MRILLAFVAAALLTGCASTPEPESKAGVEDRTPTGAAATQPSGSAATPVAPAPVQQANPLKDPNNILSKRSVFFEYDKYDVKDEFKPLIEAHARYLRENGAAKMLIQGNTDERGSREYNIALGQRRSEAVKRMLLLLGGREDQIEAVSLGEEKPRAPGHDEASWTQNRRGDMLYQGEY